MKVKKILIVDDEPHIRQVVRFSLEKAGFAVEEANDGQQALAQFAKAGPDLLVLDVLMPEKDGIEVCREIRKSSNVPILFLSSRDEEVDRIIGLEIGGDDYLTKPFSPRELIARIKAIFRRMDSFSTAHMEAEAKQPQVLEHGNLKMDIDLFSAFWQSSQVSLTPIEFGLLRTLLGYPGKVFSRDELMDGAYSYDTVVTDRTIDSHVRRIRQKFAQVGGDVVETVHGVGYKLGRCQ